ncbi:hypothetical protein JW962_01630 [Candidatus Dojkabacteria bacterium]|nr:hypothetical protein [Candidatus Dojkabacteria bacterium]
MVDLSKANKILQKIAGKHSEISPISKSDIPLFEKFFKKTQTSYGNSWIYVTQGVYGIGPNNLGYKFYDGKNLSVVIIYPKIGNESELVFYWIRPMGPGILPIIKDFSDEVLKKYGIFTFIKKISKYQFTELVSYGFKGTKKHPWHTSAHSEDDTFPEMIYEIPETLKELNNASRRRNIKKSFKKSVQIKDEYQIEISDRNFEKTAWKLTTTFFQNHYPLKKINLSSKFDYYNPIFSSPHNKRIEKRIVYLNGKPEGYYILEKFNNKNSFLYVLITLRKNVPYLADFIYFHLFETCKTQFLNTGGSEDEGIHSFKRKFKPIKLQQMYWATNYSQRK